MRFEKIYTKCKPSIVMRVYILLLLLLNVKVAIGQFVDVTIDKNLASATSSPFYGNGIAAADYDNDGDIDIYVCTGRDSPDYLYQNNDGNFESIGQNVGLGLTDRSRMALWLDIDGDADLDLLVAGDCLLEESVCPDDNSYQKMHLYRQDNSVFTDITEEAGLSKYGPPRIHAFGGLAAADINGDGFMDFVQTAWGGMIEAFINNGNGVFEEQSQSLGLNRGYYFYWQPFFHDFNSDGYIDMYCNVDMGENKFFLNNGEGFVDRSRTTYSNSSFAEMGTTLFDTCRGF